MERAWVRGQKRHLSGCCGDGHGWLKRDFRVIYCESCSLYCFWPISKSSGEFKNTFQCFFDVELVLPLNATLGRGG